MCNSIYLLPLSFFNLHDLFSFSLLLNFLPIISLKKKKLFPPHLFPCINRLQCQTRETKMSFSSMWIVKIGAPKWVWQGRKNWIQLHKPGEPYTATKAKNNQANSSLNFPVVSWLHQYKNHSHNSTITKPASSSQSNGRRARKAPPPLIPPLLGLHSRRGLLQTTRNHIHNLLLHHPTWPQTLHKILAPKP